MLKLKKVYIYIYLCILSSDVFKIYSELVQRCLFVVIHKKMCDLIETVLKNI